jgi:hypothetical protein
MLSQHLCALHLAILILWCQMLFSINVTRLQISLSMETSLEAFCQPGQGVVSDADLIWGVETMWLVRGLYATHQLYLCARKSTALEAKLVCQKSLNVLKESHTASYTQGQWQVGCLLYSACTSQ